MLSKSTTNKFSPVFDKVREYNVNMFFVHKLSIERVDGMGFFADKNSRDNEVFYG